ncbi:MAG TPA: aldehyde dehydrogenase family protein [Solirubrobacteraceae bacterium]|jgi:glyceraldehyde-3-phosphate dehydrogenase (NADP+)
MKMYVAGEWTAGDGESTIASPWSGEPIDTVPKATTEHAERALEAAVEGASAMRQLTAYERAEALNRAAALLAARVEEFAVTISREEGKPLSESRGEVGRCPDLLRLAAFEGAQLRGEVLPLDAAFNGAGKLGLAVRVPCGVVVAITPFNFPLLLVLHKLAPALAAGNAVILKPASATPLVALKLTELMIEAGLPPLALQCLTGSGSMLGDRLCSDPRVRKITFTGSTAVGEQITRVAGIKRLSLELGGNAPVVLLRDGDVEAAAAQTALGGYVNAGQVCISTQRVIVEREIYADFLDALTPQVEAIRPGDPMKDGTRLSAMITEDEAERVQRWIAEAVADGARVVAGGQCDGGVHAATVVSDVDASMRIFREELFGPAVTVTPVADSDDALRLANQTPYGLTAGVFTRDLDTALKHASMLEAGVVYINAAPPWRADLMPYGGVKQSGIGTEGPRYAVQEMTEVRTVVFNQH